VRRTRVAAFAFAGASLVALIAGTALGAEPKALVEGQIDRSLQAEISRAVGAEKTRPATRVDARRRAREAGEAAIAFLRSEGYYDYVVEPDVGEGEAPQPVLHVTPGPRSRIGQTALEWEGPPPDAATQAAALKALGLASGSPARAADVLAAEGRVDATLKARGYADAMVRPRRVVVDHAKHAMNPTLRFAAGALVRLDGVKVVGKGRTRPDWVRRLVPWKPGAVYSPAEVAKLDQRLRDASVYNSVTVALAAPGEAMDGLRPVIVSLGERAAHTVEVGGGYSTSGGAGVEAKWSTFNRLGLGDTVSFTGNLAQIQQKLDGELDLPDFGRADQIFKTGADIFADDTVAYNDDGLGVRAGVERHFTKTTFISMGGAIDSVDTREKTAINTNGIAVGQNLKLAIFSTSAGFALDRSNNLLNPTSGYRLQAEADPTYVTGDRTLPYLKVQGQVSGYLSFGPDASTVLATRLKLGSILGGDIPAVPTDRRFFSGGGGSVRGFEYQGVGPRLADGTPIGGDSLFETSFEVRRHITGPWGVAAFVDAGSLGRTAAPDFSHIDIGAGAGVRYNLGFGPLRLDLATPLTRRKGDAPVQFYLSIGQSF
jgi:translocation and assembly module TamA